MSSLIEKLRGDIILLTPSVTSVQALVNIYVTDSILEGVLDFGVCVLFFTVTCVPAMSVRPMSIIAAAAR